MKRIRIVIFLLFVVIIVIFLSRSLPSFSPHSSSVPQPTYTTTTQAPSVSHNISVGPTPAIPLQLPAGFTIHVFAQGLGRPRDVQLSPGGTLLVSNPSENSVIALPDRNGDGVADEKKTIIRLENHVHGLAFHNNMLYIANVDKVVRYKWDENTLSATKDKDLFSLPYNTVHNNRTLVFDTTGTMYVSVGSTCNVCIENAPFSGTVIVSDANGRTPRIFAKGLRNAPFLAINQDTGKLWATEMGRDHLGDNLPPDEINIIEEGKDYGWPNCYGNKIHDTDFDKRSQDPCGNTQAPLYEIPAHAAPLGLAFITSSQFPSEWQGDLLVAYHGSWNRSTAIGFKIVRMSVDDNRITGSEDFLTGFLQGTSNASALGRPVDMTFDNAGNLYVSDDRAGVMYIIQKQ